MASIGTLFVLIPILCLTGLSTRLTEGRALQVARNSTYTSGRYNGVACPLGSVIKVLDAWAVDTDGGLTCTLPLSGVDPAHLRQIQGCNGQRSCSHVDVVIGQSVHCPGSFLGDAIDTIIVEFQCLDGSSVVETITEKPPQGAPPTEVPVIGLYVGLAAAVIAIHLVIIVSVLVYRKKRRRRAARDTSADHPSMTHQGATPTPGHRFSDYANHDHLFGEAQRPCKVWECPQRRVVTESETRDQVRSERDGSAEGYMELDETKVPSYLQLLQ